MPLSDTDFCYACHGECNELWVCLVSPYRGCPTETGYRGQTPAMEYGYWDNLIKGPVDNVQWPFKAQYELHWEASYEGWGCALSHIDGKWHWAVYSHCSCNEPNDMITQGIENSLELALRQLGQEYREELEKILPNELGEYRL